MDQHYSGFIKYTYHHYKYGSMQCQHCDDHHKENHPHAFFALCVSCPKQKFVLKNGIACKEENN